LFSGDGPGPSLRGIMRGLSGANGGIGIITRAAVKMTPWYGPSSIKPHGKPNIYEYDVPENFIVHQLIFPGREQMNDFFRAIGRGRHRARVAAQRRGHGAHAGYVLQRRLLGCHQGLATRDGRDL
jgi:hypothetical protein